jgi:hypothetical protein
MVQSMAKKSKMLSLKRLTEVFRRLGAKDPEGWASSEIEEGLPQLATYVFLRQAWTNVADENDDSWIDRLVEQSNEKSNQPCAAIGPALKRLLAKGVDRRDIVDVVRGMQYELLFALCYQLDDPGIVDFLDDSMPQVEWGLFRLDDNGEPATQIAGLHESVLEFDPTGREMRPRR